LQYTALAGFIFGGSMKKLLIFILSIFLIFSVISCKEEGKTPPLDDDEKNPDDELPLEDEALNIADLGFTLVYDPYELGMEDLASDFSKDFEKKSASELETKEYSDAKKDKYRIFIGKIASDKNSSNEAKRLKEITDSVSGAYIHGINMEGPYISMAKKGAQNGAYVRNPDKDEFKKLYDGCGGCISVVDIAPECEGGEEFIKAVQPYCPVSTAHTSANYDEAMKAIEWGVRHTTHLYNAQSGLTHRAPGVVGAIFESDTVSPEIICDGFHINPAVLRIAFAVCGEDRTCVISDSLNAAGCPDGEYELGGQPVFLAGGVAKLADGTLAGSATNLFDCMKNAMRFGIKEEDAVRAATYNPACALGAEDKIGSIEEGKYADFIICDSDYNIKQIHMG